MARFAAMLLVAAVAFLGEHMLRALLAGLAAWITA
jgi:hypothetical protein